MSDQITIAQLKEQFKDKGGAVGQIIGAGLNRYVVVEEAPDGVKLMGLYGTFLGASAAEEAFGVGNEEMAWLEDRDQWKGKFPERWEVIATRYPAINTVQ